MKKTKNSISGITLIALVITIIVLLILAGVTIAMLSGKNGILSRATETRSTNAYYSASEQARLAYMAVKTEIIAQKTSNAGYKANDATNAGNLKRMVEKELTTGAGFAVTGPIEEEGKQTITMTYSNSALKAGAISGKPAENGKITFKIKLGEKDAELYEDDVLVSVNTGDSGSGDTGGDIPVTPTKKSVTELREGQEVVYTDQNGNTIPCIVLYDSTGSNGIQIISKDIVGEDIELGNGTRSESASTKSNDFEKGKESYNTAIAYLNNAARGYLNTNLATNARCVGSSPTETPVTLETNTGTYTNNYTNFSPKYDNQFKPGDSNVSSTTGDYVQMKKNNIKCHNLSKEYWLASRHVGASASDTTFYIRNVREDGDCVANPFCFVFSSTKIYSRSWTHGLRPIFILKSDIHYTDDGTTKTLVQ